MSFWENKKLYSIIDTAYVKTQDILTVTEQVCSADAGIIQFRDKKLSDKERFTICLAMKTIASKYNIPFIVNDRLDIALAVCADGVHIGQDDVPINEIRRIAQKFSSDFIIGKSSHSFNQAKEVFESCCDYFAIGPVFPTLTKPDYEVAGLETAEKVFSAFKGKPVFAIGGINLSNIDGLITAGINRVAVVSAILQSPDIKKSIELFKYKLNKEDL